MPVPDPRWESKCKVRSGAGRWKRRNRSWYRKQLQYVFLSFHSQSIVQLWCHNMLFAPSKCTVQCTVQVHVLIQSHFRKSIPKLLHKWFSLLYFIILDEIQNCKAYFVKRLQLLLIKTLWTKLIFLYKRTYLCFL